jgi:hypothetical protein
MHLFLKGYSSLGNNLDRVIIRSDLYHNPSLIE